MPIDIVDDFDDFLEDVSRLKNYAMKFILSPAQWERLSITTPLEWNEVRFGTENKLSVPNVRGVYAFVIKFQNEVIPSHGYIAYIGITGNDNDRTLQDRYSDYLGYQKRGKRKHIYMLLNLWKDHIFFNYALLPEKTVDLTSLETNLIDCLIPPYNRKDFSGTFGHVVKEAFRN